MNKDDQTVRKSTTILLIDDLPDNLKLLGEMLQTEGYNIRLVTTGAQALKVAEQDKPDLILLDILMPKMDGYEVFRQLKENAELKDIPVIFISALNDTENIVKALQSGGMDYITKPFQSEEVLARVRTHLQLHRQSKQLQEQSKQLRELNASKDKFFSIIAHDLRSPFNSIIGFSEILLENAVKKNYDVMEEYSEIILMSSRRAMDLLSNLMEWTRSQTGRMDFNPGKVELVQLITGIGQLFHGIAEQKSIGIILEIPESVTIYADQDMLSTVLRNLISNAIKFTYFGGKITVSVQENPEEITVSIRDSGVGMKKEKLEKLFRIDSDSSTLGTNKEKGTGLGLILCKEFIEKHNGKIWVESEFGKGSVFRFTIPKQQLNEAGVFDELVIAEPSKIVA
ncbi:MAG: hybrid sensor histidine kinase/response regulator [Bacteroidia bacterium]